jgi:hypothetical protein
MATTKSSFQGIVRSYGGQNKNSGVTPGVATMSEVISFLSSTTTATPIQIGSTVASSNLNFVLPLGAVPIYFAVVNAAGTTTTATVNFGDSVNTTSIAQNLVVGAKAIVQLTGSSVVASGLTANTTVYAKVGSTAGSGVVSGVITYTVQDNGKPGEQAGY